MPQVEWLPEALEDLDRFYWFLREKDVGAAVRALEAIRNGASRLGEHPFMGKPMADDTGRRELVVPWGASAYVLSYLVGRDGSVFILRGWHERENRSEEE